jgi:serine/threonine-protein kinase HipA
MTQPPAPRHDTLYLWYLGQPAAPRYIGVLRLVASGKGVSLQYGAEWIAGGFPLSEDLPLSDAPHLPRGRLTGDGERAVGAVDDARPDRWGQKVIRVIVNPKRRSLMEYLYYAGDDRFGALSVSIRSDVYAPHATGALPRLEQAEALGQVVAKIEASEELTDREQKMIRAGGSIGGAKPKALIDIDGHEWVIKFFDGEPVDSPLIEHATMTLAHKAGITVATTRVIPLPTANAVAVKRFDRADGARIHGISAGTALRAAAVDAEPDLSYPALAQLLRRAGVTKDGRNEKDARELFRRMVFNILIDNTDDHEKNHVLLVTAPEAHGKYELAPAYDVLPTGSGQGYQEFICGTDGHDSTLANAMSQSGLFGMTRAQAAAEVARVIEVVNGWREHFSAVGVSQRDIESLARQIDGDELRAQREAFSPADYAGKGIRLGRSGPFSDRGER